jgi:hypothetical protein
MADAALSDTEQGTQVPLPQEEEELDKDVVTTEEEKDAPERTKENDGEPKDGGEGADALPLADPQKIQEAGDDTGQKNEAVREERDEGVAEEKQKGKKKDDDVGDEEQDAPQVPGPGNTPAVGDGTGPKKGKGKGRKRKKDGEDEDEDMYDPQKKKAAITYWRAISREAGVSAQCVRKVHIAIRKTASRDLLDANIGAFTLHGIAKFTVKQVKYRPAYTTVKGGGKGRSVTVSERKEHKKIYAKSFMGVSGLSD